MGTSLSGLTPATTFDGLLKVGDNDPLTADLKAISDGSGNDSAIQLSTGELKVLGQFNVDTDTATTTMNLRGDGLNINQVYHANETTYNSISLLNSGGIRLKNNATNVLVVRNNKVGIGTDDPDETLHIKGSGATSATTSLLVQNSAGADAFEVKDNQSAYAYGGLYSSIIRANYINTYNNAYSVMQTHQGDGNASFLQSLAVGQTATPTARLHVKGSGNGNTTTSLLVQNSDGADVLQTLDNGSVGVGGPANASYRVTMTSGVVRLKDLLFGQTGNTSINNTSLLTMKWNGSTGIGISGGGAIDAAARLHVKGSGNDGTTTSLLVQDSAGSELFKLTDNGNINLGEPGTSPIISSGKNSGRSLKLGNQAHLSSFDIIDFKTWDGSAYSEAMRITGNTDQFVGIGVTAPTARLHVKGDGGAAFLVENSIGGEILKVADNGNIYVTSLRSRTNGGVYQNMLSSIDWGGAINYSFNSTTGGLRPPTMTTAQRDAIATPATGLTLVDTDTNTFNLFDGTNWQQFGPQTVIKGSGNDATTTALLVQNSDGADMLKVTDDGATTIDGSLVVDYFTFNGNKITAPIGLKAFMQTGGFAISNDSSGAPASTMAYIKGSGATSATTALLVENSAGDDLLKLEDGGLINIGGSNGYTIQSNLISPKINGYIALDRNSNRTFNIGDNAASRIYLKVQSSLTSNFADVSINTDHLVVKKEGVIGIGESTPTARLQVKGNGATSATTALLVENSAGTDLLSVRDDATVAMANNAFQILSSRLVSYRPAVFGAAILESSAVLQATSTTQGFLPPRMTDAERDAITNPAAGLMIYDTSNNQMNYWNGSTWIAF